MALTYTPQIEKLLSLPIFELRTVDHRTFKSSQIMQAKAKVIVFMCNHCPYIKAIESRLIALAKKLKTLEVPLIGICSNDPTDYPEDSPEELYKTWLNKKYDFDYLVDSDQTLAQKFGAVCTPDFFVFNGDNILTYRGRLDDSWKDATKVTKEELMEAVLKILKGEKINNQEQIPSMGCSIKWIK